MVTPDSDQKPLKVMVVDDHEFTRTGLSFSLQSKSSFNIVAEAQNGLEALALAEKLQPDVILMDIEMPELDGIEATQKIKSLYPETKVVILTSRQIDEEIYASLAAQADAYCLKDIKTERLIHVIETVKDGAVWLDPAIARKVALVLQQRPGVGKDRQSPPVIEPNPHNDLSERETEVLELIAQGKSNKEIADILCISIYTVKAHVRNLIQKLAVDDRTQAAVKALQSGLIESSKHS